MLPQGETQPHSTHGQVTGQAELLVTPADTNRRGTVGSVAHQSVRDLLENGTTVQEGP